MWRYYDLLSFKSKTVITELREKVAAGANPRDIKIALAMELIERFHSAADAEAAHQDFIQRFQKNAIPDEMPTIELTLVAEGLAIANVMKDADLVASTSEAIRMIKQGAVKQDGEKVDDPKRLYDQKQEFVLQVGKRRFARIVLS